MDRFKAILLITSTCLTTTLYAKQQVVCVFDPIGKSGDAFALAKDYALEAKNWGADLSLKAYLVCNFINMWQTCQ